MPTFWDSSIRFDLLMSDTIGDLKMDRLSEKLKAAGAVVGRQTAKIEARADALIAREAEIEARTDKAFSPHEAVLDDAGRGLDDLERKLALLSNDPLDGSGSSPAVGQAATFLPIVREG